MEKGRSDSEKEVDEKLYEFITYLKQKECVDVVILIEAHSIWCRIQSSQLV